MTRISFFEGVLKRSTYIYTILRPASDAGWGKTKLLSSQPDKPEREVRWASSKNDTGTKQGTRPPQHTLMRIYPMVNWMPVLWEVVYWCYSLVLLVYEQIYPLLINLGFWDLNAALTTAHQSKRCSTLSWCLHIIRYGIWWKEKFTCGSLLVATPKKNFFAGAVPKYFSLFFFQGKYLVK